MSATAHTRHPAVFAAVLATGLVTSARAEAPARGPNGALGAPAAAALAPDCGREPAGIAARAVPVPIRPTELDPTIDRSGPVVQRLLPRRALLGRTAATGALTGKTVYVSAGHGWYYHQTLGWRAQRGNTHGLVEDLISTESIAYFLVNHLRNMGADVVTVRESDPNPNRAVVDDASDGFSTEGEVDLQPGPVGFADLPLPITGDLNPFASGQSRTMPAAQESTGAAVWTFDVPEDGHYNVYVGYVADGSRASDAHYVVRHAGGESHFAVDQRRHGGTWVFLGRFSFAAGSSSTTGAVALFNDSDDSGATLSADVARIGGGRDLMDRGGGVSGMLAFEENCRHNAQLSGAPNEVYHYYEDDTPEDNERTDDVGARSRFAAWVHEPGEDAVYVAWHTNAPSPGRGTSSYAYSEYGFGGVGDFTGVEGSLELMDAVHTELISDLRAVWETDWTDDGQHTADFGEVNPRHNPEFPGVLFEIAYHDTADDAEALSHPRFRYLATRAMAQGIARYFATRDGIAVALPPEPPSAVVMTQGQDSQLVLRWTEPEIDAAGGDPATGYRVYLSRDGYAFDDGREVSDTSLSLEPTSDMVYARVTATNDGGESFPSEVVGGRTAPSGQAQVLIVGGFTSLDRSQLIDQDLAAYTLGTISRALIDRMNDGSYTARYGAAVDSYGAAFDSATAEAVAAGDLSLADYPVVIWYLGQEPATSGPLDSSEVDALAAYVSGGGRLFLSGSDVAWALKGADELSFLSDILSTGVDADDADTYTVAADTGLFEGLGEISFADSAARGYDADSPDVLAAVGGASDVLHYQGGLGGVAAVYWSDETGGSAAVVFGFPFETVEGAQVRSEVMSRILGVFGVEPDPYVPPEVEEPPMDEVGGACGCRTRDGDRGSLWVISLLLAIAVARRRRQL